MLTGGWPAALAAAGRLEEALTAIAVDGKWLRGVADGQVKLFAAMLHGDGVIIAQHRIPDDTNEITQVSDLLDPVDLAVTMHVSSEPRVTDGPCGQSTATEHPD